MSINGKLDEKLIFSRFGSLTDQREKLYSDFIEIDEKNEISEAWVRFSSNVVNDLLSVINLTKSLYERLVDGIKRAKSPPSTEELDRIKKLTKFWLDLSIMSYLYSTIEKRGLFDEGGSNKVNQIGYIETKKSLDELIMLAFQAGVEFFTTESRITIGEELFLAQEKQRLDFLDELDKGEELKQEILGEYDLKQAHFLITRVMTSFINSANSWWWKDNIAVNSLSQHAIEHISSMNINFSSSTSDMVSRGLAFTNSFYEETLAFSNLSLAQHYKRLGLSALQQRSNSTAADYFNLAVEITKESQIEKFNLTKSKEFWRISAISQLLTYKQMSVLSQISADYDKMIDSLNNNDIELLNLIVHTNLQKLKVVLESGDVAYLTSVAVTYEMVFSYLADIIKGEFKASDAIKFVEERIQIIATRLHKATHQLMGNWIRIIKEDPENLNGLEEIALDLEGPLMAILVLPPDNSMVSAASKEITSLIAATDALIMNSYANDEFGMNPVKEMLMRAKAYKHSEFALNTLQNTEKHQTMDVIEEIIGPLKKVSLLRGMIAEIQLKSAVLQFNFVNRIAPLIENSILSNPVAERIVKIDDSLLEQFEEETSLLELASATILENQAPAHIKGMPIDWNVFEGVKAFTEALKYIVRSVRSAIKAMRSNNRDDMVVYWDEAKSIAQRTSDLLAKANSQEVQQIAQQVFGLTQLYRSYENAAREGKKIHSFPVSGIIDLLQVLVMGI